MTKSIFARNTNGKEVVRVLNCDHVGGMSNHIPERGKQSRLVWARSKPTNRIFANFKIGVD
jgi:hypothetical protein